MQPGGGTGAACPTAPCDAQVEKHTLVTRLGIPWRDLRILVSRMA